MGLTAAENLRVGDGPPGLALELFPELDAAPQTPGRPSLGRPAADPDAGAGAGQRARGAPRRRAVARPRAARRHSAAPGGARSGRARCGRAARRAARARRRSRSRTASTSCNEGGSRSTDQPTRSVTVSTRSSRLILRPATPTPGRGCERPNHRREQSPAVRRRRGRRRRGARLPGAGLRRRVDGRHRPRGPARASRASTTMLRARRSCSTVRSHEPSTHSSPRSTSRSAVTAGRVERLHRGDPPHDRVHDRAPGGGRPAPPCAGQHRDRTVGARAPAGARPDRDGVGPRSGGRRRSPVPTSTRPWSRGSSSG